ncbi:MAG: FadR family transcriptional regulator [Sphingomonadaceae bacterium]|nr:FadR family transcriptional regulator [Sphingomonadaceae bacterium]
MSEASGPSPALAPPADAKRKIKLAEKVASTIMDEIRARDWPIGALLGTENELIARYKVSRATLGEAVRQVEAQGAARMQRGPRGGLIVTAPARETIVRTIASHLEFANVSFDDLFEAFDVIETLSVKLAAEAIDGDGITRLRALVAQIDGCTSLAEYQRALMAVRLAVADASGNPAIALFMRTLVRVLTYLVWHNIPTPAKITPVLRQTRAHIGAMVEAIVAGDASLAQQIVRQNLSARRESFGEQTRKTKAATAPAKAPADDQARDNKAAERLARAIVNDIREHGWQAGHRLGQETELMERYRVSRWIIRQAVRKLEVHSILRSKRGQGGGLAVAEPDPEYTIATAQTYLHAAEIGPQAFAELWFNLLSTIAQLAARRADRTRMGELRAATVHVQGIPFEEYRAGLQRYYVTLADVAQNDVLKLFLKIIARYLMNFKVKVASANAPERMIDILAEVTQAVEAKDDNLARRLMTTYTGIVGGYFTFVATPMPQASGGF